VKGGRERAALAVAVDGVEEAAAAAAAAASAIVSSAHAGRDAAAIVSADATIPKAVDLLPVEP